MRCTTLTGAGALALGLLAQTPALAAWKYYDPVDTAAIPKKFSETGFYANWNAKTVVPEAHYYDVNSPLWSDFAHKYRWVIVPAGKKITFNESSDYWDYPDSAVFVKLFKHETVMGDTNSMIWWETRVLVNKEEVDFNNQRQDKWYGFSYKWNPDGSEAYLLPATGSPDTAFRASFAYKPSANSATTKVRKWYFPQRTQCTQCHLTNFFETDHARSVLGFFTAQINRPSKANASINQIIQFFDAGLLQWKNKGDAKPTASDVATWPKWAAITDETANLNLRARSYISANCSGCHGDRGNLFGAATGTKMSFDYWLGVPRQALGNKTVTNNFGIAGAALIVPGRPDLSTLLHRQKQRSSYDKDVAHWDTLPVATRPAQPALNFEKNAAQMPPLGVYEEDTAATRVLAQWITQFKAEEDVSIRRSLAHQDLRAPAMDGRTLLIPEGMAGRVTLIAVNGKEIRLKRMASNRYSIPAALHPGLYVVRVGVHSFTRYVF